ncbi:sulfite exporter TauE/SafE family protein [Butyricicoccus sp. Marseille-Q5471]|uniref:sulfite exporter TauE/SafE family protein n=1 Tax=Butyricicoccus sp. Marseille-Q5471 TaxID=3039493 RepID=UPI0024BD0C31|nr:sulfite exporter TauE/SafE family protein [Butyricicoccus sp. Marseille-Q5471]
MTPSLAVYIFIIISCAFVVKGLAGFGDPLISNPMLAMRLDNKDITPALLPVSLILNAFIVLKNRAAFSLRSVAPIAVWVLLGIIPGTMLLKLGAPWILKVVLGLLIIGLGVEMLTRDRAKDMKANPAVQAIMSFLSGVTAGLFGINLLFLIYLERTSKGRSEFRANVCFVFFLENLFRTFVYLYNGIFTAFTLQITAITVPAAFLGMWIGSQIDKRIDETRIRKLIIYVFILGGLSTLIKALLLQA